MCAASYASTSIHSRGTYLGDASFIIESCRDHRPSAAGAAKLDLTVEQQARVATSGRGDDRRRHRGRVHGAVLSIGPNQLSAVSPSALWRANLALQDQAIAARSPSTRRSALQRAGRRTQPGLLALHHPATNTSETALRAIDSRTALAALWHDAS